MGTRLTFLISFLIAFSSAIANAGSVTPITYQGRILKPDGQSLEAITNFRFIVKAPNGCILWQEDQTIDLRGSKGAFSAIVGSGTNSASGSHSFTDVFNNSRTLTGLGGADCNTPFEFAPALTDDRTMEVSFNDGSGVNDMPSMKIKNVPFSTYASYAQEALRIYGKVFGGSAPTVTGQTLVYNQTSDRWEIGAPVAGGTVTSVDVNIGGGLFTMAGGPVTSAGTITATLANQNANMVFAGPASGAAGAPAFRTLGTLDIPNLPASKITSGTLATSVIGVVPGANGGTVTQVDTGAGLVGGPINTSGTISLGTSGVAAGSYGSASWIPTFIVDAYGRLTGAGSTAISIDASQVSGGTFSSALLPTTGVTAGSFGSATHIPTLGIDAYGRIISAGSVAVNSSQWSNIALGINYAVGSVGIGVATPVVKLDVNGAIKIANDAAVCAVGFEGVIRYAGGLVQYCDGVTAGWITLGVSGSGLQSLNGLIANNQLFAINSSGTLAAITSSGSVHTFSLPMASTTGAVGGLVSNADYLLLMNGTIPVSRVAGAGTLNSAVMSVTAGAGLTGGTITLAGTIALGTTGVSAGSYGSATHVATFAVDQYGRLTAAGSAAVAIDASSISGTLALATIGTIPVSQVVGAGTLNSAVMSVSAGAGLTGGTITSAGTLSLATTGVTAGTTGSASFIPQIGYDIYGRIVSMGSTALSMAGLTGTLGVAQGGTGLDGSAAANGSLLVGNGSGYTLGTLTYSNGMVVTNTAGTIHLATNAQSTNATLSIVTRDASGSFAANKGTFNSVDLNNAGSLVTISNPMTANYSMVLPANMGTAGQVLSTNGTSQLSWVSAPVDGGTIRAASGSASTPGISFLADPSSGIWNPGVNTLAISTAGTTRFSIDNLGRTVFGSGNALGEDFTFRGNSNLSIINLGGDIISAASGGAYRAQLGMDAPVSGNGRVILTSSTGTTMVYLTAAGTSFFNGGSIGVGLSNPAALLDVNGAVRVANDAATCAAANSGAIRFNGTVLQYCNGVGPAWITLGASGAGLQSMNGLIANDQLFAVGNSGTLSAFVSGGSLHTLNIPMGSTAGAVGGLISNADYLTLMNGTIPTARGGSQWQNNAQGINYSSGSVGIGMVPDRAFSVNGPMGATGNIFSANNIYANSFINTADNNTEYGFSGGGSQIAMRTSGSIRMAILANGSVGVGTTVPQSLFDVAGAARSQSNVIAGAGTIVLLPPTSGDFSLRFPSAAGSSGQVLGLNGAGTLGWLSAPVDGGMVRAASGSAATPGISFLADQDTGLFNPGANTIAVSTAGTTRLTINQLGNIGIGTSVPTEKLEVIGGNIKSDNGLVATNGSGHYRAVVSSMGGDHGSFMGYNSVGTLTLELTASGNSFLNGGSLGIGTTSPDSLLHVNGQTRVVGNLQLGTSGSYISDGGTGSLNFISNSGTNNFGWASHVNIPNGTGGAAVRLSGSQNSYFAAAGSLGVGTTSPQALFDVAGTARSASQVLAGAGTISLLPPTAGDFSLRFPSAAGSSGQVLGLNGLGTLGWLSAPINGGTFLAASGSAGTPGFAFNSDPDTGLWNPGANTIAISTAGTTRITIDNSGNVGIGTSTPSGVFHVDGGSAPANTGGANIVLKAQDATGPGGGQGGGINLTAGSPAGGGGWRMGVISLDADLTRIIRGGGVPYTSTAAQPYPDGALEIQNSFNTDGFYSGQSIAVRNSATRQQYGYFGAVSMPGGTVYTPHLVWGQSVTGASYQERMRMDSYGNLGIGTTAPLAMLDVNGSARFASATVAGSGTAAFLAPTSGTNSWQLPSTAGSSGQVLGLNGLGTLGWLSAPINGGTFLAASGSAGTPGFAFNSDPDTGLFNPGANTLAFSTNGTMAMFIDQLRKMTFMGDVSTEAGNLYTGSVIGTAGRWMQQNPLALNYIAGSLAIGTSSNPAVALDVRGAPGGENARIGSSTVPGILSVGYNNEIWTDQGTAGTATLTVNYRGYNGGFTQDRSIEIFDGKAGLIAAFDGNSRNVSIGTISAASGNRLQVAGGAIMAGPKAAGTGNAGEVRFQELLASPAGTNWVAFRAPDSIASNVTWELPSTAGSVGQALTISGSGTLAWNTISSGSSNIDQLSDGDTTSGTGVVFLGASAGASNTGGYNTSVGISGLGGNTSGSQNVTLGYAAGWGNGITGAMNNNTLIGAQAGMLMYTARDQTALGANALSIATNGSANVAIGARAGSTTTSGNRNILIGTDVLTSTGTTSNFMSLGNLIFGNGIDGTGTTPSSGNVGIGTVTPVQRLTVNGGIAMTGAGSAGFLAPIGGINYWQLPSTAGSSGQVLGLNGLGTLGWMSASVAGGTFLAASGSAGTPGIAFNSDPDTGLWNPGANTLAISTAGTNRVSINNLGYVGVATNSPSAMFHVKSGYEDGGAIETSATIGAGLLIESAREGAFKTDAYINFWAKDLALNNDDRYGASRIRSGWEDAPMDSWNESYISFQTHHANTQAWNDSLVIKGGNVGVRTITPTAGLHVANPGAASLPGMKLDGTWFAGGSTTTTKPQLLIEPAGVTSNNWGTLGTGLGINSVAGFTGSFISGQVDGVQRFGVNADGNVYAAGIGHSTNSSNSYVGLTTTGVQVQRNINDNNVTLMVEQLQPAATGDLLRVMKAGTTAVAIHANGNFVMSGSGTGGFQAPSSGSNIWRLPSTAGSSGQVLGLNGVGTLGWLSVPANGGTFLAASGSAGTPGFSFNSDQDTGIYSPGANQLGISTAGTNRIAIDNLGNINLPLSSQTISFNGAPMIRNVAGPWDGGWTNVFIGTRVPHAAFNTAVADRVTLVGHKAGMSITDGGMNTFVGTNSGASTTTGANNTYMGNFAGWDATGSSNVFIGDESSIQTGGSNVALGADAGSGVTSGNNNVFVGQGAVGSGTINNSVIIGQLAGNALNATGTTNDNNIFIGYRAGYNTVNGGNNIMIGTNINTPATNTTNFMSLGNIIFANGVNGTGATVSTGSVGIGTNSPVQRLTVNGGIAMTGAGSAGFLAPTGGINYWQLPSTAGTSGQVLGLNGAGTLGWITAPTNGGTFLAANGSATTPGFAFNSDQDSGIYRVGANTLGIATAGTSRIAINNLGYVGIGDSNPSSLLTVGQTSTYNTTPRQTVTINSDGIANPSAAGSTSLGDKLVIWNENTVVKNAMGIGSASQWVQFSGDGASYQFWGGSAATPAEIMRITAGGTVGIGTTAIASGTKLEVTGGDIRTSGTFGFRNGNTFLGTDVSGNGHLRNNGNFDLFADYDTSSVGAEGFRFYASNNSTSVMEVTSTKVSIGTLALGATNLGTKLEVTGGAILASQRAAGAGNAGEVRFGELLASPAGTNWVALRAPDSIASNISWELPSAAGTSGQVLGLNGAGTLGWITAPVNGGTFLAANGSAATPGFSFNSDQDTGIYRIAANTLGISTGGTFRVSVANNGNVGIGTLTPAQRLDVNGRIRANELDISDGTGTTGEFRSDASGVRYGSMSDSLIGAVFGQGDVRINIDANNNSTNAVFAITKDSYTTGTELLRVQEDGYVGIGITNPWSPMVLKGGNTGTALTIVTPGTLGAQQNSLDFFTRSNDAGGFGAANTKGWQLVARGDAWSATTSEQNDFGFSYYDGSTWKNPLWIDSITGNIAVGGGTVQAANKMEVAGTFRASSISSASATATNGTMNLSTANAITTSYDCTGTADGAAGEIVLQNIRDGGSYSLVVTGTGTARCGFNTAVTGADAATVTYRFNPANGVRVGSSHTVYTLLRVGNIIYVSWITGF